jgi:predicted DsbA family dithiol-disulfide isomerase
LVLKEALLQANFTDQRNVSDHGVLAEVAGSVGLDAGKAAEILASDTFAEEVRADEYLWRSRGINAVPSVIINQQWLIQGGQPPEVFEQALRQVVNGTATAAE